eukprot:5231005-Pleurochrysis_carterae.AAC.3
MLPAPLPDEAARPSTRAPFLAHAVAQSSQRPADTQPASCCLAPLRACVSLPRHFFRRSVCAPQWARFRTAEKDNIAMFEARGVRRRTNRSHQPTVHAHAQQYRLTLRGDAWARIVFADAPTATL